MTSCSVQAIDVSKPVKTYFICDLQLKDLQGAACYGDYLFQFTSQDSFNKDRGVLCYSFNDPSSSFFVEMGFNENYHNSHVSFGESYYDNKDPFPLLYVSENNARNGFFQILVYRIIKNKMGYEMSLVQSIPMPKWVFDARVSYPHAVVDVDDDCLWIEGYSSDGQKNVFAKFRLPVYPSEVISNDSNPLVYFEIPRYPITDQSFTVYDNKVFQVLGSQNSGRLRIIELDSFSVVLDIQLFDLGLTSEPEAVFIWRGFPCVSFIDGLIYRIVY